VCPAPRAAGGDELHWSRRAQGASWQQSNRCSSPPAGVPGGDLDLEEVSVAGSARVSRGLAAAFSARACPGPASTRARGALLLTPSRSRRRVVTTAPSSSFLDEHRDTLIAGSTRVPYNLQVMLHPSLLKDPEPVNKLDVYAAFMRARPATVPTAHSSGLEGNPPSAPDVSNQSTPPQRSASQRGIMKHDGPTDRPLSVRFAASSEPSVPPPVRATSPPRQETIPVPSQREHSPSFVSRRSLEACASPARPIVPAVPVRISTRRVLDLNTPNPFNSYGRTRFKGFKNDLPSSLSKRMGVRIPKPAKEVVLDESSMVILREKQLKEAKIKAKVEERKSQHLLQLSTPKTVSKKVGFVGVPPLESPTKARNIAQRTAAGGKTPGAKSGGASPGKTPQSPQKSSSPEPKFTVKHSNSDAKSASTDEAKPTAKP